MSKKTKLFRVMFGDFDLNIAAKTKMGAFIKAKRVISKERKSKETDEILARVYFGDARVEVIGG